MKIQNSNRYIKEHGNKKPMFPSTFSYSNLLSLFSVLFLILISVLGSLISMPLSAEAATIGKPNNYLLQSGLVGWWTFDGQDMIPNVRDRSGQGNHASLFGQTATTTVPGKVGQGLKFDGLNDYASTTLTGNFGQKVTISAWVKFNSMVGNDRDPFLESGYYTDNEFTFEQHNVSGILMFTLGSGKYAQWTPGFTTNRWHHLVVVVDTTQVANADKVKLYMDNVLKSQLFFASITNESVVATSHVRIGGRQPGPGVVSFFDGYLDDMRFYNRALSASEVAALYNSASVKHNVSVAPASPITQGLVGHWTFDGKDMLPNVRDISGQGNHGNLFGQTSTTTAPGKLGQALSFDGVNDYVSVSDNASLDIPVSHTLSVWVKLNSGTGDQAFLFKGLCGAEWASYALKIGLTDAGGTANKINYTIRSSSVSDNYTVTQLGSPPVGVWTHIVGTHDGTTMRLYIDGVLDNTASGNASAPYAGTTILEIGSDFDCASGRRFKFGGLLDDARIYNHTLSASEIRDLYNSSAIKYNTSVTPSSTLAQGLVGHWTFDGKDMIPNVRDISGQGNHGNLIGQVPTTTAPGKLGQALMFDGTSDLVTVTDNDAFDGTSLISWSFWVNDTTATSYADFFTKGGESSGLSSAWAFMQNDSVKRVRLRMVSATSTFFEVYLDYPYIKGWKHVVVTLDGSLYRGYLNGQLYVSGSMAGALNATTDRVTMGGNVFGADAWKNSMDDVRIYNRTLSASEILQLYNLGR